MKTKKSFPPQNPKTETKKASFLGEALPTCSHMPLNQFGLRLNGMDSNQAQNKEQVPCQ
jgi:hypothetical protein